MSWYSDNKEQWKQIIETVASDTHRNSIMIEKDTIQSIILFELSRSNLSLVFKGGTSLSKAYGLIDRFSEDIDLSMDHRPTDSEKRRVNSKIIEIADSLGLVITNIIDIRSRYDYNKYIVEYESLFSDFPLEIIIETSFFQAVYPIELHTVNSYVGEYCKSNGINFPISFDAISFDMPVQTLDRTFIDKVFAICDYKIQNMQDRDSRHLYDIAKLVPEIEFTPDLKSLIDKVRDDRMKSKNNPSAQPEINISVMLKNIISTRFYEADYNNITSKLLYEDVSYDEAIQKGIASVIDKNIF